MTVEVTPTDPAATGSFDQAPVQVAITNATAPDVLVAPVNALVALPGVATPSRWSTRPGFITSSTCRWVCSTTPTPSSR